MEWYRSNVRRGSGVDGRSWREFCSLVRREAQKDQNTHTLHSVQNDEGAGGSGEEDGEGAVWFAGGADSDLDVLA
jgi:hypothetical protein